MSPIISRIGYDKQERGRGSMKVLNFEDSVYKANAIRKVLNQCGVAKIELVSNVEDGLQMLKNAEDTGDPFDLIITDMHYPMKQGAVSDTEAGEKLVQLLQEQGKQTKVIVCSSRNMKLPGVYGCIWYSEISDWEEELCDLVREMEKNR